MSLPGGSSSRSGDGMRDERTRSRRPPGWVTFTPMAFDGLAWVRVIPPQPSARFACLSLTAFIHLLRPGTPLRDLDARAEPAIRALEDGAVAVMIIDGLHRVDRTGPCAERGDAAGSWLFTMRSRER